jgi:hypothetical protein
MMDFRNSSPDESSDCKKSNKEEKKSVENESKTDTNSTRKQS